MFRGIGLVTFRRMNLTEAKLALYSSVVFGAVHLSNALAPGTSAIFPAIIVSFSGCMFDFDAPLVGRCRAAARLITTSRSNR
jgi:uncharacterized protein